MNTCQLFVLNLAMTSPFSVQSRHSPMERTRRKTVTGFIFPWWGITYDTIHRVTWYSGYMILLWLPEICLTLRLKSKHCTTGITKSDQAVGKTGTVWPKLVGWGWFDGLSSQFSWMIIYFNYFCFMPFVKSKKHKYTKDIILYVLSFVWLTDFPLTWLALV